MINIPTKNTIIGYVRLHVSIFLDSQVIFLSTNFII